MGKRAKPTKAIQTDTDSRSPRGTVLPPSDTNNIRNWRLFRGISTQKELAEITRGFDPERKGIPRVSICRIENGETPYSETHLALLSKALRVSPRDLIGTNPFNAGDVFAIYAQLSESDRKLVLKYVAALRPMPRTR